MTAAGGGGGDVSLKGKIYTRRILFNGIHFIAVIVKIQENTNKLHCIIV